MRIRDEKGAWSTGEVLLAAIAVILFVMLLAGFGVFND